MSVSDIANIVIAITTLFAIFIGIYTFRAQNRFAQKLLGIQILRDFEEKFFRSKTSRQLRFAVCNYYRQTIKESIASNKKGWPPNEVWRLADEFASISFYIKNGYVDIESAWSTLYYWIDPYWYLFEPYMKHLKADNNGVDFFIEFNEIHELLTKFGIKYRNLQTTEYRHTAEKISQFLEDEIIETRESYTNEPNPYSPRRLKKLVRTNKK